MKNIEFKGELWRNEVNVSDFIDNNYSEYLGDSSFLENISEKTKKLMERVDTLLREELKKQVLDIDTTRFSGITSYDAGYIDKENEVIVGLQTDAPLKRIVNPYGGIRMVEAELETYNYTMDNNLLNDFKKIRKTHNDGVFDAYTDEIKASRKAGLITGLPDAYGRGRIIGDYRRVALYGIDFLVAKRKEELNRITDINEQTIRLREEVSSQIKALEDIKEMALKYGYDISTPAKTAQEAIQWLYFGYLASVKENNGAAMSLGRVSTFIDIYIERDLQLGIITEMDAQELIDQFVIKLRLVRHLRTREYDSLFAGDPTWVTEAIGGMKDDEHSLVTKTSFRFLHTLENLSSAPEPNITILWSSKLPVNFKKYCSKLSIDTSSIQYENDDIMRPIYGHDYGIACCVSAMRLGKDMQFFGARCNLAKSLLYSINEGIDEISHVKILTDILPIKSDVLNYDEVVGNLKQVLSKVAKIYVDAMNIIHYMHDKYAYEASQMALHDIDVRHLMAFGVAGLSVIADSLSAIKYAKVTAIRDEDKVTKSFKIEGDYPKFGNDDDRVDSIAIMVLEYFMNELKKHTLYKGAMHTMSVLTITSNVVYGLKTGATPDGREKGIPFAPGANPMHGRDIMGALASLNSVAKIPYKDICQDGISNTFTIVPQTLGNSKTERIDNLSQLIDGYMIKKGHHINVNVLNKETLKDAMNNPHKYPNLTIRVSGYAVKFNRLSKQQQLEVINRTFHEAM
ncbi:MAG: formate C-acetyltransferase [bacterium]|nr:formate C-acetyltransferase [bacterium]